MPAVNNGPRSVVAAATPTTRPATETIPSLAPSTPARSQFNFPLPLWLFGVGRPRRRALGFDPVAGRQAHDTARRVLARSGSQMTRAMMAMASGTCTAVRVSLLASTISPPM